MPRQFAWFAAIGAAGFAVDATVLWVVMESASADAYVARAISFVCAATSTWFLHRRYTFPGAREAPPSRQWLSFIAANMLGGAVNLLAYTLLIAMSLTGPLLALACGSLLGLVWNFLISRTYVFAPARRTVTANSGRHLEADRTSRVALAWRRLTGQDSAGSAAYPLLFVCVLALSLRVAVALWLPQEVIWPDGHRYERIALHLLAGEGFGDLEQIRRAVPTQPLFIAAVYLLFGESYLALRIASSVLGVIACALGFLLTRALFGPRAALAAGLLLAAYPHLVYVSALFEYPQTLGIACSAGFLLTWIRFREDGRVSTLWLASVLLGVATLTFPTLLIFLPIYLLALFARAWRRALTNVAVAVLGLAVTIGVWATRNYVEYGRVIIVNAAAGTNFWVANNATYAQYGKAGVIPPCGPGFESSEYCRQHQVLTAQLRGLPRQQRVLEHERRSWELGLKFVLESPVRAIMLSFEKMVQLWSPWPDAVHTGVARGGEARDLISAITYVPVLLLAILGLLWSKRHWHKLTPVLWFAGALIVPFAFFLPTMRYRLPIDFLLIMLAGFALTRLRDAVTRPQGAASRVVTAP